MAKHQMRTLRWVLVAAVVALVSCGDGSSSSGSEATPSPTDTGAEITYKVGDTGPGGGIIVYVDEAGFSNSSGDDTSIGAMCLTGTCKYLETAPADLEGKYRWEEAMAAAEAYSTPSANDWVLPSKDALNQMCKYAFGDTVNAICNEDGYGFLSLEDRGFYNDNHWSSSEYSVDVAWTHNFQNGSQWFVDKGFTFYVRPVRAFGGSTSSTSESTSIINSGTSEGSCAQGVICAVGDTGPGGGIIVYVDEAGFSNSSGDDTSIGAMCLTGTCKYLEMAVRDLSEEYSWEEAMAAAEAYSTPSANDWVLPSKDALNQMCKYAYADTVNAICNDHGSGESTMICCFTTGPHWSSSEGADKSAWLQNFGTGYQASTFKIDTYYVRPARAF